MLKFSVNIFCDSIKEMNIYDETMTEPLSHLVKNKEFRDDYHYNLKNRLIFLQISIFARA